MPPADDFATAMHDNTLALGELSIRIQTVTGAVSTLRDEVDALHRALTPMIEDNRADRDALARAEVEEPAELAHLRAELEAVRARAVAAEDALSAPPTRLVVLGRRVADLAAALVAGATLPRITGLIVMGAVLGAMIRVLGLPDADVVRLLEKAEGIAAQYFAPTSSPSTPPVGGATPAGMPAQDPT